MADDNATPGAVAVPTSPTTGTLLRPVEHWQQLAADTADDDADSALGSDASNSTASLTSSILAYRTIHGRTFHSDKGDTQYWASNDAQQNESMDIAHHFLTLTVENKLYLAPLKDDIRTALDIGTGTGVWAIDFADEFPGTEIIGTDISPIQPSWVPPNLKFEIDDCTQEWTFDTSSIDYVHMRYLVGSIKDWSELFKEAFRVCKPGGWVESHEAAAMMESDDGTVADTSALHEWGRFFIEGGKKLGQPFTILENDMQRKYMEEAGFVDITVENRKIPVGGWPSDKRMREIGIFVQAALEKDFEGYVLYMASQLLGWTMNEVRVYCAQLRREIRSGKHHAYFRFRAVYGRKPT
ncbi:S-adenosyl-L-methionine-dependent methyltransferase [Dactylonectria macrodidyma]|uniref:S-adenosyl-L-methionine-dependent methyltransferase n=1 Tax=Dactylonectria macrodidyma TaxID=307937 RepID=A0A9P9JNH6_9HYPO|nr:S-adenosyl-L-methionine-dependent methyltransferase [Dactylonectria macrodidyma]